MKTEIRSDRKLYLKWGKETYGWGVFTESFIPSGSIVESCYGLLDNAETSDFQDYIFRLNNHNNDVYHLLGFGAIYNHSDTPNIYWEVTDETTQIITFYAIRDIQPNEELTHNYGVEYWKHFKNKKFI